MSTTLKCLLGCRCLWPGNLRVFVYSWGGYIHEVDYCEIVMRESGLITYSQDQVRSHYYCLHEPVKPNPRTWTNTYSYLLRGNVGTEVFDLHRSAYVVEKLVTHPIPPNKWNPFAKPIWVRKKDKLVSLTTFFDIVDKTISVTDVPSLGDWLTLDAPIMRNREWDIRNHITLPDVDTLHKTCILHEYVNCASDLDVRKKAHGLDFAPFKLVQ